MQSYPNTKRNKKQTQKNKTHKQTKTKHKCESLDVCLLHNRAVTAGLILIKFGLEIDYMNWINT